MVSAALLLTGCENNSPSPMHVSAASGMLVGAWRSHIIFRSGPLVEMKGLEFLYAYNAGGTMTESSNFDEASNSSPPAYGVWREINPHTFETKYLFYTTQVPGPGDGAPSNSDWWPAGHGVITETITLSDDGKTYASTIKLTTFDRAGKPIAGESDGTGAGVRIDF